MYTSSKSECSKQCNAHHRCLSFSNLVLYFPFSHTLAITLMRVQAPVDCSMPLHMDRVLWLRKACAFTHGLYSFLFIYSAFIWRIYAAWMGKMYVVRGLQQSFMDSSKAIGDTQHLHFLPPQVPLLIFTLIILMIDAFIYLLLPPRLLLAAASSVVWGYAIWRSGIHVYIYIIT